MELDSADKTASEAHSEGMVARLKTLIGGQKKDEGRPKRIHIIINPAAGKDLPFLKPLNYAMQEAEVEWDVFLTKQAGDAQKYAEAAKRANVDRVLVHGGDGTFREVASGLIGSNIPVAILPGGTANVMAAELGIAEDIVQALALAVDPQAAVRKIDIGKVNDRFFFLRSGMGIEATMIQGADRELKDKYGVLAYVLTGLQSVKDAPVNQYHLVLDGIEQDTEGVTCMIANSGAVGKQNLYIAPDIDVSDGLLDVIVLQKVDLPSLLSLAATVLTGNEPPNGPMQHWKAREITVTTDSPEVVQADGEIIGESPIHATVIPQALTVVVAAKKEA